MLRLNHSNITSIERKNGGHLTAMSAVFDDVTKAGNVRKKHAQRFSIRNNVLELNGVEHTLDTAIDMTAKPEDIIEYFDKRFNNKQPDMFLVPPTGKRNIIAQAISINDLRWEHPDLSWRAIDKSGAVAYFDRRPVLDKAGYWVAASDGVLPRYGKTFCFADSYQCSVQHINDK